MKIIIAAFGKLKTPGAREMMDHYLKLSSKWAQCTEIELKPKSISDRHPSLRTQAQAAEESIFQNLMEKQGPKKPFLCLLDERGRSHSTQNWSQWIQSAQDQAYPAMIFGVGSAHGFSDSMRKSAHRVISLGTQTMAHELARVVLAEQIFRSLSLLHHHPYHIED